MDGSAVRAAVRTVETYEEPRVSKKTSERKVPSSLKGSGIEVNILSLARMCELH